jgi:hypothetical protein
VYERTAGSWTEAQAINLPNPDGDTLYLMDLALSPDGEWLAAGVFSTNRGYVEVYRWNSASYAHSQTLQSPAGAGSYDGFGQAIAISENGTMVIGDPSSNEFGTNDGRAYVFKESAGSWSSDQTLETSVNLPSTAFGFNVDITPDGSVMIISDAKNSVSIYSDGGGSYSLTTRVSGAGISSNTFAAVAEDALTVVHSDGEFNEDSSVIVNELDGTWSATQTISPPLVDDVSHRWHTVEAIDLRGGNLIVGMSSRSSGDGLAVEPSEVTIYSRDVVVDGPYSDFWTGFERSEERIDEACG